MKGAASIDPDLLKRAEEFAREHAISVSTAIEEALCNYHGGESISLSSPTDRHPELPTAKSLKMVNPDDCGMSFGKLIDLSEESLSLDKAQ
jgi:hypothetical protein